jgi:hypothetical protein
MSARNRKLLGIFLLVVAVACIAALIISGDPPVRMSSTYFEDTGKTKHSTKIHWSVLPSMFSLIAGALLLGLSSGRRQRN